ncbi:short-chain dehydrogenase [Trichoderma arundinaceum]|uniref:Short-chain dehydrogenase n=1 Tax=Trichoderma arundinaceum TaxID=490622 RepID=A0A395NA86_TRIAR|nr:short-chain dehydrogenase [Trichoderma arundinaceum]
MAPFPSWTKEWHSEPYPAISPTRPELSSAGRVVVITGGGSGIGAAIARAFALAGSEKIAIISRTQSRLDKTKAEIEAKHPHTKVLAVAADITREADINNAFDKIEEVFGKIDVYVSNSAWMSSGAKIAESETAEWWQGFETNVLGAFLSFKAFHKHASPKGAYILNIDSGIAHMPPIPTLVSAYAGSKAAATKLFDYIAFEYPEYHVVNIQPGVVDTELNQKSTVRGTDHVDLPGHFAVWLTSPEAVFLRNKFVWVNWDVDELKARKNEIGKETFTTTLSGVSFADWVGF